MDRLRVLSLAFATALLITSVVVVAQIDTAPIPSDVDTRDLYARVTSSKTVIVGKALQSQGVSKRLTPELRKKMQTSLDAILGGTLYTIVVERQVCSQRWFQNPSRTEAKAEHELKIFVALNEPKWAAGNEQEYFLEGQEYLLFVTEPEPMTRTGWIKTYSLDPNVSYVRAYQGMRGVVQISRHTNVPQSLVLTRLEKLCGAVKATDLKEKLKNLQILATSDDPGLREDAKLAIAGLENKK
jgi:hypothetical protein